MAQLFLYIECCATASREMKSIGINTRKNNKGNQFQCSTDLYIPPLASQFWMTLDERISPFHQSEALHKVAKTNNKQKRNQKKERREKKQHTMLMLTYNFSSIWSIE